MSSSSQEAEAGPQDPAVTPPLWPAQDAEQLPAHPIVAGGRWHRGGRGDRPPAVKERLSCA
eukprot:7703212-Alexandrium_andersonii.AAC.1